MTVLDIELRNAGWPGKAADFRKVVTAEYDAFIAGHSPAMRPEDFLLRPALALAFADRVRSKFRTDALRDHTILGSLLGRAAA